MRDGTPLPGRTPAQLVSQLAHRVLGPLRPHRIRAVLDYHGLRGAPAAAGQAEIAATYGVHVQSVSNWVATVAAAGAHLPLSPEMATQISRRSRPDEDHRGRTRVAHTFGFPPPARPPAPAPAPQPRIPPQQWTAAGIAVRVLATLGPLPLPTRRRRIGRPGRQPPRVDRGAGRSRLHPLLSRRPHHHDPPTDHPHRTGPVPADRTHRAGTHRSTAALTSDGGVRRTVSPSNRITTD